MDLKTNHLLVMGLLLMTGAALCSCVAINGASGDPSLTGTPQEKPAGFTDATTGMQFVSIKGGCFQMGSKRNSNVHEVCLDGFAMGKYEVTQGQWQKVMGSNPSTHKRGNNFPVESVSWDDAKEFIQKLNGLTGKQYRLPTEAEWEYAARAGTTTSWYWGNDPTLACEYANVYDITANKWQHRHDRKFECDDGYADIAPVGSFKPNAFGLYDMIGNVFEWCQDTASRDTCFLVSRDDPQKPRGKNYRSIRGGSWDYPSIGVLVEYLHGCPQEERLEAIGLRLVLSPE